MINTVTTTLWLSKFQIICMFYCLLVYTGENCVIPVNMGHVFCPCWPGSGSLIFSILMLPSIFTATHRSPRRNSELVGLGRARWRLNSMKIQRSDLYRNPSELKDYGKVDMNWQPCVVEALSFSILAPMVMSMHIVHQMHFGRRWRKMDFNSNVYQVKSVSDAMQMETCQKTCVKGSSTLHRQRSVQLIWDLPLRVKKTLPSWHLIVPGKGHWGHPQLKTSQQQQSQWMNLQLKQIIWNNPR